MVMLEKTYRPAEVEEKHYRLWEETGAFAAKTESNGKPYTIMMPPPNVTGSLHMGHALTFTLQDVLTRYNRMRGRDALWQPGTDHAGIATQMVVERNLAKEGKTRHDFGRDAFIDKVWEWKAESGGTITRQLRRLGASPDWPRERFTMDEGLSRAVRKVFVELHKQGLIYKDKRLVNWDPKLHTAISDLEVEQKEIKGNLWHFRYPIEGEADRFIVVATTRPETMLGDTGVAVHPEDERYKDLIGKNVVLPLVGRLIPIVGDEYADPETGSGAVKITPAHDFNDFEVGRRNNLAAINIMDRDARITGDEVPEAYRGLDRYEARKKVVAELEELGLLEKIEPHTHMVPHGDRSGVAIEPWLTDQWYVDAATLAKPAIEAVETGKTVFVPRQWENTYFEWMRNIQPWCVSRQIWWGHQIPAWYGPDGHVFVEETEEAAIASAKAHYGQDVALTRDQDVLDTWFSSALWPFSTLGWPDETPELARYYPTDVLVTGFDIIFFWVARMMMMGLHFMKDVPFRTVYIHALVRDEKGQKMSKSKGNVIDPLELIDQYGTDALRFTLTAMAAQGRDIKLAVSRVEGYRNFATKLWNAARYTQMNGVAPVPGFKPVGLTQTVNRWIVGALAEAAKKVGESIEAYKFNEAANTAYAFTWGTFCDWYLEFTKPILNGSDEAAIAETRATTAWVLDEILHMLHPLMPFITEELWEQLSDDRANRLISAHWPEHGAELIDPAARDEMDWVVRAISSVRSMRSEMNVPPAAQIELKLKDAGPESLKRLDTHRDLILRMGRLASVEPLSGPVPKSAVQAVLDEATLILPLEGIVDLDKERARLTKEIEKLSGEIKKIDAKLSNEQFVAKAPEEVIEEQRDRRDTAEQARDKLQKALEMLAA
ncbi:valine--tRNA ligase [Azospirillum brasilense]|uniref:Valine--tRNA ligase n=2 Tax=Azospirillum brasilense TaxID=192 RepID=A0A0P0F404_AZOBR|nr:valine--tRNA ligase [Azospirillum brasilense]PWC87115.1 valyl-tRNA synthetase [Azospirillum sp. Sp 7]QCO07914.1 valine--tRNA ligase [Azospirillum brasilense]QEL90192.1 valine--tRNA ligase [Azospirillum brasilense]QEL96478.1 valine--tRNA ligase [Azospirillum brasilense]